MEKWIVINCLLLLLLCHMSVADPICSQPTAILVSEIMTGVHSHHPPNTIDSQGQQMIFTGSQLECYGYVTSWSALTVFDSRFISLTHRIYFQIWRPFGDGSYQLVGSELLTFSSDELGSGVITSEFQDNNNRYFYFTGKTSDDNLRTPIHFQPGDLIGCFIPALYQTLNPPLSVVYSSEDLSNNEAGNMLISYTSRFDNCEVVDCGDSVDRVLRVSPQVTAEYVPTDSGGPTSVLEETCTPSPFCCPFSSSAHRQIGALSDCMRTSFSGDVCQTLLPSTLHIEPSMTSSYGHQIVFPDISFDCHGYIDSWSALTILDIRYVQPYTLTHQVYMQVWRPVSYGKYHLVASEELRFLDELSNVHKMENSNNAYFAFRKKTGSVDGRQDVRIHFEPGDVIGVFVPARFGTLTPPLSLVYSPSDEGEGSGMVVGRMKGLGCETNECGGSHQMSENVLPWISMKIVSLDSPEHAVNLSEHCNASLYWTCPSAMSNASQSTAFSTTHSPSCSGESCGTKIHRYGIVPIIATTVILVVASLSLTLCSILFCLARRRSNTLARRYSVAQPFITRMDREDTISDRGNRTERPTSSKVDTNSACCYSDKSESDEAMSRRYLDDGSTRFSDLLEFHSYTHDTGSIEQLKVTDV